MGPWPENRGGEGGTPWARGPKTRGGGILGILGRLKVFWGPSWGHLGAVLGRLGAVLGPLGAFLESFSGRLRGPKTQSSEVAKMSQNAIRIAFLGPRGVQERAKLGSNCDRKTCWSHHATQDFENELQGTTQNLHDAARKGAPGRTRNQRENSWEGPPPSDGGGGV